MQASVHRRRSELIAALPAMLWLVMAAHTTFLATQWWGVHPAYVLPLSVYALLYGYLGYASWRASRWPVLAAEFYFVGNALSLVAGWTLASPESVASTAAFGLIAVVGFRRWPTLNWGVLGRPLGGSIAGRDVGPHLRDFLADVPPSVIIAALGVIAIQAAWAVWLIIRFCFDDVPGHLSLVFLALPALGLVSGTLVTALARLSRAAALAAIAVPAVFLAGNGGMPLDALAAAPAIVVFAALLLPHWPRMTWRLFGYPVLPRAIARAFN